jgi:hypothetical protein
VLVRAEVNGAEIKGAEIKGAEIKGVAYAFKKVLTSDIRWDRGGGECANNRSNEFDRTDSGALVKWITMLRDCGSLALPHHVAVIAALALK